MDKYIHVKIGTTDGVFPATLCTDGAFTDFYEYRPSDNSIAWVHKRWCTPCATDGLNDTDWRKFLREHWDNEHNCCRTDCLEQFYSIFHQACSNYMHRKTAAAPQQKPQPVQPIAETAPKQHYVQLTLFD